MLSSELKRWNQNKSRKGLLIIKDSMSFSKLIVPKCIVFMSTYNGESFLAQQIETILSQVNVNITLKIRDDGSSDGTIYILEKYKNDPRVELVLGNNKGLGGSFLGMLYSTSDEYDYYAFSDQDDKWDKDKLYAGHAMMADNKHPTLYYCGQRIVDEKGQYIRSDVSLERIRHCTRYSASKTNMIRGCTMIWNSAMQRQLLEHKPDIDRIKEHDVWVSWMAFFVGKIIFDKTPHMDYRQYDKSVSPGASMHRNMDVWHKLKVMKYIWCKWNGLKTEYAKQLEAVFPECKLATSSYKCNLNDRLVLMFSPKYNEGVPIKWRLLSDLMILTNRL
jgi:rhamnosyltransferase